MTLKEIYQIETTKWDSIADGPRGRITTFAPEETFESYSHGRTQLRGVTEFLGDLKGKRVLEYGCGLGHVSTLLLRSGAHVTSFDLSRRSVDVTERRIAANTPGRTAALAVAAGETLPFADESFDIIFGKAILHHLDVSIGANDLYRVLKTGGKAVFSEPMGMNPVLNVVRDHVWYPKKTPRGADKPLSYQEIHAWGARFREFHYQEVELLSMLERGFGFHKKFPALRQLDDVLLEKMPPLRRYCRYVVMYMVK
ncbi:MAG TPA: methyltransferase domain-containing protein [Kouleothrix sp.]|jgi:SAM-dependent methyltransferase|nr:methyltransferase domain-containing protein [Kouleothrix sp.]